MSNPLDEAFAKARSKQAAEELVKRKGERAEELAVRDWLKAYGEVLTAVPRYVSRAPEKITLAWPAREEPPSSVEIAGVGKERGASLTFGTCDAWRFSKDLGEKTWMRFLISTDCATIFTTKDSTSVSRGLRRAVHAHLLDSFVDVRTGRHTLRLDVSSSSGDPPYSIHRSSLPRPESIAETIAGQELDAYR